jgi:hypothetical protein
VKRTTAKRLAAVLDGLANREGSSFRTLERDSVVWEHPWLWTNAGKKPVHKKTFGAWSLAVRNAGDPLAFVLVEFSPHRHPGVWYLVLLDEARTATTLAELHRIEHTSAGELLAWTYKPIRHDKKNAARKEAFCARYPAGGVALPLPGAVSEAERFVWAAWDLVQARVAADNLEALPPAPDLADPELVGLEGVVAYQYAVHRSRERGLRDAKLKAFGAEHGRVFCEVPGCGFDFEKTYGAVGAGFAEVHHLRALSDAPRPVKTRMGDLAIVCANCHRMIHRGGACRGLVDLGAMRQRGAA